MKRETRDGAKRWAENALKPALRLVANNDGAKSAIVAKMTELARKKAVNKAEMYHRQEINFWLHADPAKRIEPKLGIGLLLIEAAEAVAEDIMSGKG